MITWVLLMISGICACIGEFFSVSDALLSALKIIMHFSGIASVFTISYASYVNASSAEANGFVKAQELSD